ncbi:MAG: Sec-independent protein translocase protein TatB [Gammaproteobacteria bacterium]|nr:Sec-independent protein translocase protein TatB [Gammaproteobacteria bacterium]
MFDIGFFELVVIGVVLLLVMGPERLPEVAKQIAFFIRKARQGVYRLRSEMQSEIDNTPFADIEAAKREMDDFKNDIKQFGRDLADSAQKELDNDAVDKTNESSEADSSSPKG